jgi:hypothetical protein
MGLGGPFMCLRGPIHMPSGAHLCAPRGPFKCPAGYFYVPEGYFYVPSWVLLCTPRGIFKCPAGYFYVPPGVFLSALRVLLSGGGSLDDVPSARPFESRFMNVAAPMKVKIAKNSRAKARGTK